MDYDTTALFFNPNIAPVDEYQKRLKDWKRVREVKGVKWLIREDEGFEPRTGRNRCGHCYQSRLEVASRVADELGVDVFTTTLSISPYQNHSLIKSIGDSMKGFRYFDLREYFRDSQKQARSLGLYLQKYCGCLESQLEAQWLMKSRREKRRVRHGECMPWKPDCVVDRKI